jgi:hypothetical protein
VRVDRVHQETTFPADIFEGLRAARVVVAVCSPLPPKSLEATESAEAPCTPNVNVLYEVGIAHALGKPTIILTTDTMAVPADLVSRHLLTYNRNDVTNGKLCARLEACILSILKRMQRQQKVLTDPGDAAVSESDHWAVVHTESWKPFLEVIKFAKRVHNVFQDFEVFLMGVRRDVEEIVRQPEIGVAGGLSIRHKREAIETQYRAMPKRDLLGTLQGTLEKIDGCFAKLIQEAGEAGRRLSECRQHYEILKEMLKGYRPLTEQLERPAVDPQTVSQDPEENARKLLLLLIALSEQTTSLAVEGDNLILSLIDVLAEGGGDHD